MTEKKNKTKKAKVSAGGIHKYGHRQLIVRFSLVLAKAMVITSLIIYFLVRTTTVHRDDWNRMGLSTLRDSMWVTPLRGEILAADGSILATNLYYYNVPA